MIELKKNILLNSGTVVQEKFNDYKNLWEKISEYFLTEENMAWFKFNKEKTQYDLQKSLKGTVSNGYNYESFFWELFSFNKVVADKNETAIKHFEDLMVKKCYVVQDPNYVAKKTNNFVVQLIGKYDVAGVNDLEEFKLLEQYIQKGEPIPFWVIDNIANFCGREVYVFDDSLTWIMVLTHENEVFFHCCT